MNNNILLTLVLIGAFCSLPSHREGQYIAYCLVKSLFCAYFILIYFYLKGHQRPDEAFSAPSIEEHSSFCNVSMYLSYDRIVFIFNFLVLRFCVQNKIKSFKFSKF